MNSREHGYTVAGATNVVGDNYPANFIRGFVTYYDDALSAKRQEKIDAANKAFLDKKLAEA